MWTMRLENVPEGVNGTAVCIDGKIYSFDPDREDVHLTARDPVDVYIFDPASCRWARLLTQSLPDGSPWHSTYARKVVAYGHSAYLLSDGDYIGVGNVVYRFDTKTMAWSRLNVSGQWPEFRLGQSACVVGCRVFFYGGWPDFGPPVRKIDFLDLETMRWHVMSTSGEMPDSLMYHSASAIGSRMYVWGGISVSADHDTIYDNSLVFLDTATSTWVRPRVYGLPPKGREDHSSFVYKNQLYIFGGLDFDHGSYFHSIHKYSPETSCWTQMTPQGSGPPPRRFPGCGVIGQRVFVFGGQGLKTNARDGQPAESNTEESSLEDELDMLTDMHILDFAPTLKIMCLMAVIDTGVHVDHLPPGIRNEIRAMIADSRISPPS